MGLINVNTGGKTSSAIGCVYIQPEYVGQVVGLLASAQIPFNIAYQEQAIRTEPQKKDSSLKSKELQKAKKMPKESFETKIEVLINQCLKTKRTPSITDIAAECEMPIVTFKLFFKSQFNQTFYQYYLEERFEYAAELLRKGYNANAVSSMAGYGDKSAIKFNKMFQKHFGMTPKKYQMSHL
jgi:AraC-like DNA-binding protein